MPKAKFAPIPWEDFEKAFQDFYLARGEFIGKEGDESLRRYEVRLASFYETFKVYKLERVKEAMQSYQESHSAQERFPSNGDLWDEMRSLPEPVTKFERRELSEEDRIENEKLAQKVRDIAAGKKVDGTEEKD